MVMFLEAGWFSSTGFQAKLGQIVNLSGVDEQERAL